MVQIRCTQGVVLPKFLYTFVDFMDELGSCVYTREQGFIVYLVSSNSA